jgi:hypothetical protein
VPRTRGHDSRVRSHDCCTARHESRGTRHRSRVTLRRSAAFDSLLCRSRRRAVSGAPPPLAARRQPRRQHRPTLHILRWRPPHWQGASSEGATHCACAWIHHIVLRFGAAAAYAWCTAPRIPLQTDPGREGVRPHAGKATPAHPLTSHSLVPCIPAALPSRLIATAVFPCSFSAAALQPHCAGRLLRHTTVKTLIPRRIFRLHVLALNY